MTHLIHHVGLTVSQLEESVRFYCNSFGFEQVMQQQIDAAYLGSIVGIPGADVRMAHLRLPGGTLVVELFQYVSGAESAPRLVPNRIGNAHLCFVVDDIRAEYERLLATGVDFVSAPVAIDAGRNTGGVSCYLRDPDGITLELFQAPPEHRHGSAA